MTGYLLDDADRALVDRAATLLKRVAATDLVSPAQLVSVGKALHALSRMPQVSHVGDLSLSVISPRRRYDDIEVYFWWDVAFEDSLVTIKSGGHFYRPSTGGDTFRSMTWQAYPGEPAELSNFHEHLAIVPGLRSFLTDIPTTEELPEFKLSVEDESNQLLEEECQPDESDEAAEEAEEAEEGDSDEDADDADQDEEGDDESADWVISPRDGVEQALAAKVDPAIVDARRPQFAYGVEQCGLCDVELDQCGLMVDGRLKGSLMWGNLCARCFAVYGEGLGDGAGQLYARQPDGRWRLVAGFPS